MCVHICVNTGVHHNTHMGLREQLTGAVYPFVSLRKRAQVVRFGGEQLYQLAIFVTLLYIPLFQG